VSLFCDFVYFSTVFSCFTVFYLFPPPNTLLSCYYYQILCLDVVDIHVLSIWHQDMWKKSIGSFLFIGFPFFSTHFWHCSMYSSCFYPATCHLTHTTHLYLSHWTCNHTWIASNNVIFCMSCYYNFHLNILLGSDFGVLGHLWSQNDAIMSWLRLTAISNCFPHPY
jgi:hypothetical protein